MTKIEQWREVYDAICPKDMYLSTKENMFQLAFEEGYLAGRKAGEEEIAELRAHIDSVYFKLCKEAVIW